MPVIVRVIAQGRTTAHRFSDTVERILIGRGEQCDVQIDEGRASRAHCQIQRTPQGQWKLVDLESRNGTKIDGLMVNARVLAGGESVAIGATTVQFEASGLAPAAAPVAAPAPAFAPAPALARPATPFVAAVPPPILAIGGTVQMSRPPSGRLPEKKGASGIVGLAAVAAVLMVVLFGAFELNGWVKRRAAADQAWSAAEAAEQAAAVAAAGKIGDAVAAAQDRYRRFARDFPAHDHADAALAAARRLGEQHQAVLRWERVLNTVASERATLDPTFDRLADWHARLAGMGDDAPHSGIGGEISILLGELTTELSRYETGRVAEVQQLAAADLDAGEFAGARQRLRAALSGQPPLRPEHREAIETELRRLDGLAEAAFQQAMVPVDQLASAEAYDEAARALEEARRRFRGFDACELQAEIKVRVLVAMRSGGVPTAAAETLFKSREEIYRAAIEADQRARERDFDAAITSYERIVEASDLREVKAEFQAKVEDCRRQQQLWRRFLAEASAGTLGSAPWANPSRGGEAVAARVAGADADGVTVSVGAARMRRRFADLDAAAFLSLLRLLKLSPDEELAWVIFAYQLDQAPAAEQALAALLGREPGRAAEIHTLISRQRKEPLPSGGYVLYEGRFVSAAQRGSLEANASLDALVNAVRHASADALPGAVQKLTASKDGKPLALSVLQERLQDLVGKLDKHLGPIGGKPDAQLVALREELDKRRTHALTLIWDVKEYPDKKTSDPDFYRRADDEVHRRIATVTEMWENAYKSKTAIHPKAAEIQEQIGACDRLLRQVSGGTVGGTAPRHDPAYLRRFAGRPLTVQTYPRDWREEYVIAYSHLVTEINARQQSMAGDAERDQVRITNEYRMMMFVGPNRLSTTAGDAKFDQLVPAVLMHEQLIRSARWHSEYMAKTGEFGHVLPGHPHGDSPFDRMKRAGYDGNGSENIHVGHGDPRGAHLSWLHSANHHRNILTAMWRSLGSAVSGKYWTQNFGNQRPDLPEFRAPAPAPGGGKARSR